VGGWTALIETNTPQYVWQCRVFQPGSSNLLPVFSFYTGAPAPVSHKLLFLYILLSNAVFNLYFTGGSSFLLGHVKVRGHGRLEKMMMTHFDLIYIVIFAVIYLVNTYFSCRK